MIGGKEKIKLGVVCLARKTFDYQTAEKIYSEIQASLTRLENAEIVAVPGLVIEIDEAKQAAQELLKHDIDGLVCISGTFHLGHLVLEIDKTIKRPLLLWGLPELPYDGGKIRLNSVCGVNLNASNLYKSGTEDYTVHIGPEIDEDWVDAVRVSALLRRARIGIAGSHAHGFFNIGHYPPLMARETGLLIDHYELDDVWNFPVGKEAIAERKQGAAKIFDVSGITDDQLTLVASLTARLDAFCDANRIDALAIRCWPEFAAKYGISPCAAMSILQSEGRVLACEGDIDGAVSMLAHRAVGGETPFLFDFSQINFDENYALFWHCGVAPCNLWDGRSHCSLDTYFAGGKGVTADFVLKEGDVSILRFDSTADEYRVFLGKAHGVPMEKDLKGTYLKAVFDEPIKDVFERVVYNGVAHHASMVYGDYIKPFKIFARMKGWRTIE